ncbi:MAG: lysylphosphatidylglycerol synthase transmembrane domain-containing protein [Eubacteriales bacterium]|nr:lysylphosphatidylglycerol synthase transmembrane domain-containing protein [Eubacteriales bacterium]
MTEKRKKILLNFVFLAAIFTLTVYLVFRGEDVGEILQIIRKADGRYLLLGIVCVILFIIGESVIIYYMMKTLGAKVHMGHCALYSFVGFFFSCITPSATGGQPMQIYYMKKDKLDIPVSTLVLMIVTITYKAVLVLIGAVLCLFGRGFLKDYLGEYMWVFYLGVGLNVFCVALMLTLVFAPGLAKWLMVKGLHFLERFRILKKKTKRLESLERSMDKYHETAAFWAGHKRVILNVLLITIVQRTLLFTVTYWTYRALGLHGAGIGTITVLQSVISVSVDMLPLPGGMGISETLYLLMFRPVFGELLLPSMVLSRGIAYYGQLLISAVMTCAAHFIIGRKVPERAA